MPIVAGRLCAGHPNAISLAATHGGDVSVLCNDGTGDFTDVLEPHGEKSAFEVDYRWQIRGALTDLAVWAGDGELDGLYGLGGVSAGDTLVLLPHPCLLDAQQKYTAVLSKSFAGGGRLLVHPTSKGDRTWTSLTSVGPEGIRSLH